MLVKKQNLFLFFEENEHKFEISSDLVRLSMNRFIIDEEAQFEIIGVYNLKKTKEEMTNTKNPNYKKFAKERTDKEAFDKDLISEAVDKALSHQTTSADTHFIIGSQYHLIDWRNITERTAISTRVFDWISSEIKDIGLQSLYCTIYLGTRQLPITQERDGQRQGNSLQYSAVFSNIKSSINDDLEEFIQQIRNGCRPSMKLSNKPVMMYLIKMLTKNELKEVQTDNRQFLSTICENRRIIRISKFSVLEGKIIWEECNKSYKDLIKETKFIFCCASRCTTLLK